MADTTLEPGKPVFSRRISTDDSAAFHGKFEASPDERLRLAALFKVEALHAFSCRYTIEPLSQHRYRLSGELRADLTQACVLTLEPVEARIVEAFAVEFWPAAQISATKGGDDDEPIDFSAELDRDPPEAIADGKIDVGAFVAEILAAAIDPYPRKAGAEFVWQEGKSEDGTNPLSPFAQLAQLKRNQ